MLLISHKIRIHKKIEQPCFIIFEKNVRKDKGNRLKKQITYRKKCAYQKQTGQGREL